MGFSFFSLLNDQREEIAKIQQQEKALFYDERGGREKWCRFCQQLQKTL
jgi:hypothetical protein